MTDRVWEKPVLDSATLVFAQDPDCDQSSKENCPQLITVKLVNNGVELFPVYQTKRWAENGGEESPVRRFTEEVLRMARMLVLENDEAIRKIKRQTPPPKQ